ncbi:MAG: hypothetical protein Q8K60_01505 [Parachlamydiaceae bacterium]|nr:hypothetical protein [Parachlamydiaceae bacterium]
MGISSNIDINNNVVISYSPIAPVNSKTIDAKNFILNIENQNPDQIKQQKIGGLNLNIKVMEEDLKISKNQILSFEQLNVVRSQLKNRKRIIFKQKIFEKNNYNEISEITKTKIKLHNNNVRAIYQKNLTNNPNQEIKNLMTNGLKNYLCFNV